MRKRCTPLSEQSTCSDDLKTLPSFDLLRTILGNHNLHQSMEGVEWCNGVVKDLLGLSYLIVPYRTSPVLEDKTQTAIPEGL